MEEWEHGAQRSSSEIRAWSGWRRLIARISSAYDYGFLTESLRGDNVFRGLLRVETRRHHTHEPV
jgi:hypothetical protein